MKISIRDKLLAGMKFKQFFKWCFWLSKLFTSFNDLLVKCHLRSWTS